MGISTISMVIFDGYGKLPKGTPCLTEPHRFGEEDELLLHHRQRLVRCALPESPRLRFVPWLLVICTGSESVFHSLCGKWDGNDAVWEEWTNQGWNMCFGSFWPLEFRGFEDFFDTLCPRDLMERFGWDLGGVQDTVGLPARSRDATGFRHGWFQGFQRCAL